MTEVRTSGRHRRGHGTSVPKKTVGFGFDPEASPHHFAVVIDKGTVVLVERFRHGASAEAEGDGANGEARADETVKATLTPYLWDRISEPAAAEFNRRLQGDGLPTGSWRGRDVPLAPHFGKELALLAWAVEDQDADPTPIPTMVANWNGLAPEERWWFYTTINAAIAAGRNRGWRRAIKIAFAENPVHLPAAALLVGPMPDSSRRARRVRRPTVEKDDPEAGQLGLWTEETTR